MDTAYFTLIDEGDVVPGTSSKKYCYDYDDYEENNKNAATLIEEIKNDSDLPGLSELIIGSWGDPCSEGVQPLIDGMIEIQKKEGAFSHIKSLFVGDMSYEECEVSWIMQGNYSKLWDALPDLEQFGVRGSEDLELGQLQHGHLKELDIVCGGLSKNVIASIRDSKLPALERLTIYIGVEDYGFDGSIDDITALLERSDFPALRHLGIENSEIQDEITQAVFQSKYISQIESLSLANGTLTDKGAQIILDNLKNYPNIKNLDLHYNYLTDSMCSRLEALAEECVVTLNVDDSQEAEEYDGELWYATMLSE